MRTTVLLACLLFHSTISATVLPIEQLPLLSSTPLGAHIQPATSDRNPDHKHTHLPTLAARIERTSPDDAHFDCGPGGEATPFWSGYGHLPRVDHGGELEGKRGVENKHSFWMLFPASSPDYKIMSTVLSVGGGPGSSGLGFGFGNAGPCKMMARENGTGYFVHSAHAWTDDVNLLMVDHPVGAGWSYADSPGLLSNNSRDAGYEMDQLLQGLFAEFEWLGDNDFHVHSGSYGGTFVPNIVSAIHARNLEAKAQQIAIGRRRDRIHISVDSVMLVNPLSDLLGQYTWLTTVGCNDLNLFNSSSCAYLNSLLPACTDALRLTYDQPESKDHRLASQAACEELGDSRLATKNVYDARQPACSVFPETDKPLCFPSFNTATDLWNRPEIRAKIGVPDSVHYENLQRELVGEPYEAVGDEMHATYKLLTPLLEETGMRLLVYSGMQDLVCHWRSTETWMRLLRSPYQSAFLKAKEETYLGLVDGVPGVIGSVRKVGEGAGEYVLFKIREAGHVVIASQPALVKKFQDDGYLVIPNFYSQKDVSAMLERAKKLIDDFDISTHPLTAFTTGDGGKHVGDRYFLESNDKISFFLEPTALSTPMPGSSTPPQLLVPKNRSVNKFGHALAQLDDVFREATFGNERIRDVARGLRDGVRRSGSTSGATGEGERSGDSLVGKGYGHEDPRVLQSMVICKQPNGLGARVPIHNDSTFLYTDPPSAIGYWIALEDCTSENGALSFLPGSHKRQTITSRFVRLPPPPQGPGGTGFIPLPTSASGDSMEQPVDWQAEEGWREECCSAGSLVLIHGSVQHASPPNHSPNTRFIYTFHMIEGAEGYDFDGLNWLQPPGGAGGEFEKLFK